MLPRLTSFCEGNKMPNFLIRVREERIGKRISEKKSDIKLSDKEKELIDFYQFDLEMPDLAERKRLEIINDKFFSKHLN
jgi:hypothetical protein